MGKWKVPAALGVSGLVSKAKAATGVVGRAWGKKRVLPTDDDVEPSPQAMQGERETMIRKIYNDSQRELDVVEVGPQAACVLPGVVSAWAWSPLAHTARAQRDTLSPPSGPKCRVEPRSGPRGRRGLLQGPTQSVRCRR